MFWSADWTPWSIGSDVEDGEFEKGLQFSTIQLSLTKGNFDSDSPIQLEAFSFSINRIFDMRDKVHNEILLPADMLIAVPTLFSTE